MRLARSFAEPVTQIIQFLWLERLDASKFRAGLLTFSRVKQIRNPRLSRLDASRIEPEPGLGLFLHSLPVFLPLQLKRQVPTIIGVPRIHLDGVAKEPNAFV